ncbi:TIGR02391 family protein [Streptomyces sp. NPDC006863]|uniref:TIGR02391 family protein n=1 Tax=Streptomyces sp. NPDC006863 TaxID=3154779 RepID=UPI0034056EFA
MMTYSGPVPTDQIRELPTPELAMALLRSFGAGSTINANNMLRGAEQAFESNGERDTNALLSRLSDAWAWLVSRGLIGPHPKQTDSSWKRVTSLGREMAEDPNGQAKLWAADRLAGTLAPALEEKVRPIFNLGDYETACFAAMKAVEVEVRTAARLDSSVLGVDLMRQALRPGGPLADQGAHGGEVVALMELFAGAIGAFKNPSSHRTVHFDDPVEAAEVVQLADLLLRLLHRAQQRNTSDGAQGE